MTTPRAAGFDPDWQPAETFVERTLGEHGPSDRRIIAYETQRVEEHPALPPVRRVQISVLGRAADIAVFFDAGNGLLGWRDDGRLGTATRPADPDTTVGTAIAAELDLGGATLGQLRAVFLDPLGWTYEARFRLPNGRSTTTARAWANPETKQVIQFLRGRPSPAPGDEPLTFRARATALDVLLGRLRRAGIRPLPAHRCVLLTPQPAEHYPGGTQIRLANWRHWSFGFVEYQGARPEPIGWRIDRLADQPPLGPVEPSRLVRLAQQLAPPPPGSTRPSTVVAARSCLVRWTHEIGDLPLIGDYHQVEFEPAKRKLIGVRTRWSPSPALASRVALSEGEALTAAERWRDERGVDRELKPGPPSLCFFRPTLAPAAEPRLAWKVGFADAAGMVDYYIDGTSGALLGLTGTR